MLLIQTMLPVTKPSLPEDLEELFRQHSDFICRTAYQITRNSQDAEDILQTIFIRLMRRESLLDVSANSKAYLYRAAVNLSLDLVSLAALSRSVCFDHEPN